MLSTSGMDVMVRDGKLFNYRPHLHVATTGASIESLAIRLLSTKLE
jgi:hypothetical protein